MAAETVATMALETLRDLLVGEVKLLARVSGQVEDVQRTLRTMHCFLKDADKKDGGSTSHHAFSNCVTQLRELATRAEDVLERHAIEVVSMREGKNLKMKLKRFTCILRELSSLHELGVETALISADMTQLTNSLGPVTQSGGVSLPSNSVDHRLIRTYGLEDEVPQHFVGMEKDIQLLKSLITTSQRRDNNGGGSNRSVISICGMGGLGKTTLATKIYNMEGVKGCFDSRAWVCISQQLKSESVLRGLLEQLEPGRGWEDRQVNEDHLVRKLHQVLTEKNCLVVLDDIWKVDHWNKLKSAFPLLEGRHCKVLLTSRDKKVAADIGYIHELKHLDEDEGWELLQKIALPINHHPQPGLSESECKLMEEKGREIVKKCGYLPLAISVMGGILKDKKTPIEWEKVKQSVDSYLQRGDGVEGDTRIKQILDLSYNVLPYNLKSCFLYLGCFPEDREIDAEQLYLIWMAEGMISAEDKGRRETLRDVAERYLFEMANRCMVQVKVGGHHPWDSRFATCRLHDLMRDLCLSKGKQEQFMEVEDAPAQPASIPPSVGTTIRRLAIHGDKFDDSRLVSMGSNRNLRSLLVLGDTGILYKGRVHISLKNFGKFRSLKILILEHCSFKNDELPKGIEKLILLKHLSLRRSSVKELPRSLHKLRYLQSLDLRTYGGLELSDLVIPRTERLRHLALPNDITHGRFCRKMKLEGLSELETLLNFNSDFFEVTHLLKMQNLQRFSGKFSDEESLSLIVHHISEFQDQFSDTELSVILNDIDWEVFTKLLMLHSLRTLDITGRTGRLPTYEPQLYPNLVRLELSDTEMEEDPMETLEKLPRLQNLGMTRNSFVGRKMVCRAGGFPQLRCLLLYSLHNLVEWRVEEKAMPKLSYLHVHECRKLEMLPEGLRFITSLQQLSISAMPQKFNNRLKLQVDGEEGGEDYEKIKHIPRIVKTTRKSNTYHAFIFWGRSFLGA